MPIYFLLFNLNVVARDVLIHLIGWSLDIESTVLALVACLKRELVQVLTGDQNAISHLLMQASVIVLVIVFLIRATSYFRKLISVLLSELRTKDLKGRSNSRIVKLQLGKSTIRRPSWDLIVSLRFKVLLLVFMVVNSAMELFIAFFLLPVVFYNGSGLDFGPIKWLSNS